MNFIKSAIATASVAVVLLVGAMPAKAGSFNDSDKLIKMIEATGTQFSINSNNFDKSCADKAGYYRYIKDKVDVLVVCSDQVDIENPDELWETVSHESVHVAQACNGGAYFKSKYHPRMLRHLRAFAPHYAEQLMGYRGDHKLTELEAFWAELQKPEVVMTMLVNACAKED